MIWEYKVIETGTSRPDLDARLNQWGQDGWECFNMDVGINHAWLYFKRPKTDPNWLDKVNGFMRKDQPDVVPLSTDSQAVMDAKKFSDQVKALTSDEKKRIEDGDW